MGAPAKVLDPGAGRCEFINAIPAAERWVVDVLGCEEFRGPGVKAVPGSILDVELPLGHFDGVFVSNLLEHLPAQDTVGAMLARLREAMEPGGTWLVPSCVFATAPRVLPSIYTRQYSCTHEDYDRPG
jgi:hypothetical protein